MDEELKVLTVREYLMLLARLVDAGHGDKPIFACDDGPDYTPGLAVYDDCVRIDPTVATGDVIYWTEI